MKKIGDCQIVSRRARPTKLQVRDRRMLIIEIRKNRTTRMGYIREELQQELGSFISISTMRNEVNLLCYQIRATTNKSMFTKSKSFILLTWCIKRRHWTMNSAKSFSEETNQCSFCTVRMAGSEFDVCLGVASCHNVLCQL